MLENQACWIMVWLNGVSPGNGNQSGVLQYDFSSADTSTLSAHIMCIFLDICLMHPQILDARNGDFKYYLPHSFSTGGAVSYTRTTAEPHNSGSSYWLLATKSGSTTHPVVSSYWQVIHGLQPTIAVATTRIIASTHMFNGSTTVSTIVPATLIIPVCINREAVVIRSKFNHDMVDQNSTFYGGGAIPHLVVAARGTVQESIQDWLENLELVADSEDNNMSLLQNEAYNSALVFWMSIVTSELGGFGKLSNGTLVHRDDVLSKSEQLALAQSLPLSTGYSRGGGIMRAVNNTFVMEDMNCDITTDNGQFQYSMLSIARKYRSILSMCINPYVPSTAFHRQHKLRTEFWKHKGLIWNGTGYESCSFTEGAHVICRCGSDAISGASFKTHNTSASINNEVGDTNLWTLSYPEQDPLGEWANHSVRNVLSRIPMGHNQNQWTGSIIVQAPDDFMWNGEHYAQFVEPETFSIWSIFEALWTDAAMAGAKLRQTMIQKLIQKMNSGDAHFTLRQALLKHDPHMRDIRVGLSDPMVMSWIQSNQPIAKSEMSQILARTPIATEADIAAGHFINADGKLHFINVQLNGMPVADLMTSRAELELLELTDSITAKELIPVGPNIKDFGGQDLFNASNQADLTLKILGDDGIKVAHTELLSKTSLLGSAMEPFSAATTRVQKGYAASLAREYSQIIEKHKPTGSFKGTLAGFAALGLAEAFGIETNAVTDALLVSAGEISVKMNKMRNGILELKSASTHLSTRLGPAAALEVLNEAKTTLGKEFLTRASGTITGNVGGFLTYELVEQGVFNLLDDHVSLDANYMASNMAGGLTSGIVTEVGEAGAVRLTSMMVGLENSAVTRFASSALEAIASGGQAAAVGREAAVSLATTLNEAAEAGVVGITEAEAVLAESLMVRSLRGGAIGLAIGTVLGGAMVAAHHFMDPTDRAKMTRIFSAISGMVGSIDGYSPDLSTTIHQVGVDDDNDPGTLADFATSLTDALGGVGDNALRPIDSVNDYQNMISHDANTNVIMDNGDMIDGTLKPTLSITSYGVPVGFNVVTGHLDFRYAGHNANVYHQQQAHDAAVEDGRYGDATTTPGLQGPGLGGRMNEHG
jgi:hypothetical protein